MLGRSYGPQLQESDKVHADKYRQRGESFREAMSRVAAALSETDEQFHALREILLNMRFLPGGRIQTAIGSTKKVTPYNCYVSGTIADSFVDGQSCIMDRAKQAAATMRMGGGIGYDFSTLRPRGALIKKLQSHSSGPIPFMEIFDAVCRATSSSGARRGAQMGVLRIDHPDIEDFIRVKQNTTELTGFNISVAVTDEFMSAVERDAEFPLRFGDTIYRQIAARTLWEQLMRSTYDWAEPGVIFIDRVNNLNNLYYCEKIAATNPCGEQPLPPYGACLLGSFNLPTYLDRKSPLHPWTFDYERFFLDIPHVVRAMDRVIDVADYPLQEQEVEANAKRRMGLGVTGLANCIEAMGFPYGSPRFIAEMRTIFKSLRDEAYRASSDLAKEKGSFPLYNREKFLEGQFIRNLPMDVKDRIEEQGIRNSHLLSIAPTGTISVAADNVSSGIEPVFALSVNRAVIETTGVRVIELVDYGLRTYGVRGKTTEDVTADEHIAVLCAAQEFIDSAVSKTCNVPNDIPWEAFQEIYIKAYKGGAKGCTTYRKGCLREGILEAKADESYLKEVPSPEVQELACGIDPTTGRRTCE